ncbi:translocation and assembly module lipoprotein TamL [Flavitalea antarctica]
MKRRYQLILIVITGLILGACSNLKKLPAGEKLYTGAAIVFDEPVKDKKEIKGELEKLLRPVPNSKILGMRIRLSLYNMGKPTKKKGLNHLLRNKWGEPPVLYSRVKPENTSTILNNYMWNHGFFKSVTEAESILTEKTAKVKYHVRAGHRYEIDTVGFPEDSSALGMLIKAQQKGTLLKRGKYFNLDDIKDERSRIDSELKNHGYFYFNPDYLIVQVDSTLKGNVNLFVKVKERSPRSALVPYDIKNIYIYANYRTTVDTLLAWKELVNYPNYKVIDTQKLFKPKLFQNIVTLNQDSIYSREAHNVSLKRLVDLGTFKYIRASFEKLRDSTPKLNASFYLTPTEKRSLQFQLNGTSKSNNFVGSQIQINMKNRNFLRGAELLDISLAGGFEKQVGGQQYGTNGTTLTGDINLFVPRFIVPFRIINPRTEYVPRTRFNLGFEFLNRKDLYRLDAVRGGLGYVWRESRKIEHDLSLLGFTYTQPSNITPRFDSILKQDYSLQQAFEKQFIIGSNYTFTYNESTTTQKWNATNIRFNVDVAGNILGLATGAFKQGSQTKTLLGIPFAQYLRFSTEASNYWKLTGRGLTWANRVSLGYGYAYGNSQFMPYVKQFFIGGSNSIRAFRARTLGPGSYYSEISQSYASEAGEVKAEINTEMRMKLFSIVNAAAFIDAGNIWLRKENPQKPGSGLSGFWKDFAVGTGVGLRFDASIIIVRFDLAFPLRKPWLPEDERWVIDKISFGSNEWRKDNLILNIAIGYPF